MIVPGIKKIGYIRENLTSYFDSYFSRPIEIFWILV